MKKLLLIPFVVLLTLSACGSDDEDGGDGSGDVPEVFNVLDADNNEFVVSVSPAHEATDVTVETNLSVTFTDDFPVEFSDLDIEIFGFPKDQDCEIAGSGFVCDGEYPLVFEGDLDDDGHELAENTWHIEFSDTGDRPGATYEYLTTDNMSASGQTVTFTINGGDLRADMSYVVHLFGGEVQYSDQEGDDMSDFKTYWIFTTVACC